MTLKGDDGFGALAAARAVGVGELATLSGLFSLRWLAVDVCNPGDGDPPHAASPSQHIVTSFFMVCSLERRSKSWNDSALRARTSCATATLGFLVGRRSAPSAVAEASPSSAKQSFAYG